MSNLRDALRGRLLAPRVRRSETVDLSELLGEAAGTTVVEVRELTGRQKAELDMSLLDKNHRPDVAKMKTVKERTICRQVYVPGTEEKVFELQDLISLHDGGYSIINVLHDACERVNGERPGTSQEKNSNEAEGCL